jgi:hypothetical protein
MIFVLDADMNGTDSYQFLIDAGLVTTIEVPTFEAFDKTVRDLLQFANPKTDVVFLDSISQMAYSTRGDAKFGTDIAQNVWDRRGLFLDGDKNYLTVYEMAGQMIIRRLKNLRSYGFRLIVSAHESDQIDTAVKKRAPDINQALYGSLKRSTSDMFRMWLLPQNIMQPDGQTIRYAAGTRLVSVKPAPEYAAKIHVDPFAAEQVPQTIPIENPFVPVLPKVYSYLWKLPSFLCIYGEPGVGKTTAGVSEAFEVFLKANYPERYAAAQALYNQQQRQTYEIATPDNNYLSTLNNT